MIDEWLTNAAATIALTITAPVASHDRERR
jgi:hypothetical protein